MKALIKVGEKNQPRADILAADDSLKDLRLIVEILSRQGYSVRPAIKGEGALASIRSEATDSVGSTWEQKGR